MATPELATEKALASPGAMIAALQRAIDANDVGKLKSLMESAPGIAALAESTGHTDQAQTINYLLAEAQQKAASSSDRSADEAGAAHKFSSLTQAISIYMSEKEKHYLEGFDPNSQYYVQARDEHGKLKTNSDGTPAMERVSGQEIRDSFTTVKYNSLTEEQKKAVPEELRPKGSEQEQMQNLRHSIDTLEARQAMELHIHGTDKDIRQMTEHFDHAREKIKRVEDAGNALEHNATSAFSALSGDHAGEVNKIRLQHELMAAREDLAGSLQRDVLDKGLQLKKGDPYERFETAQVDKAAGFSFTPSSGNDQAQHTLH